MLLDSLVPPSTIRLNSSVARLLLTASPAHAFAAHRELNPDYRGSQSGRMDMGAVCHTMLFGCGDKIRIVAADDWRTKAAQAERDAAYAANERPILAKDAAQALAIAEISHASISRNLCIDVRDNTQGDAELEIEWESFEVACRGRMDWISADRRLIVDYKTAKSANPDAFIRSLVSFGGDVQAAFYHEAANQLWGTSPQVVYVVQEIEAPFATSIIALSTSFVNAAILRMCKALTIWADCIKNDRWPTYADYGVTVAEPPPWYIANIEAPGGDDDEESDA